MLFGQITIVGVGLIGGSVGLAAKVRGVAGRVVGVGRDRARLEEAVRLGAIDTFTTDLAAGVAEADLVVVCTPVDGIAEQVVEAARACRPGTLLTDAGSTKGEIVARIDRSIRSGIQFVGSHPMAGSEKGGVEHARADLFDGRTTIVTPSPTADEAAVFTVMDFWSALGSATVVLDPAEHDDAVAATSHVPHAAAAAVALATGRDLLPLTAGGFRDITRVAAGDPALWAPIFLSNRAAVLDNLAELTDRLADFRRLLEAGDGAGLVRWLADAKQVRDALGT